MMPQEQNCPSDRSVETAAYFRWKARGEPMQSEAGRNADYYDAQRDLYQQSPVAAGTSTELQVSLQFLEHLYKEKEIHKEHRHKHVMHKLVLSSTFFGLGQFSGMAGVSSLFLYVVPLIALVHDLYIFAEDYKVKRVGFFLRQLRQQVEGLACPEEILWEQKWLRKHRERWAYWASFTYTLIITVFAAVAIFAFDYSASLHPQPIAFAPSQIVFTWHPMLLVYLLWLLICAVATVEVFFHGRSMRTDVKKMKLRLKKNET
jgi:hypothetical protein